MNVFGGLGGFEWEWFIVGLTLICRECCYFYSSNSNIAWRYMGHQHRKGALQPSALTTWPNGNENVSWSQSLPSSQLISSISYTCIHWSIVDPISHHCHNASFMQPLPKICWPSRCLWFWTCFLKLSNMLCLHACSRPSKICSLWRTHCGRTPMITLSWEYPPALQWPLLSLDGLQISSKLWSLKLEGVKWHFFIMVNQVSYGKYSSNLKLRWGPPTSFLTLIAYSKKNQCATWAQGCHLLCAIASNNC